MKLFDDLLEKSAKLADQATKLAGDALEQSKTVAGGAMEKGKKKMEELSLESELGKAHKQLGSLVYVMYKTGEKNEELIEQYCAEIAAIEEKLASLKPAAPAEDYSLEDIEKAADDLADSVAETAEEVVEAVEEVVDAVEEAVDAVVDAVEDKTEE